MFQFVSAESSLFQVVSKDREMLVGREELGTKWHSGVSASISMQTPEREIKDGTPQCFLIQQI